METIQFYIEVALSLLLTAGIFYSIYLGRALTVLRRDRKELVELVASLEESGRRAEDGVEKLQIAGDVSGRALGRMIDHSKLLRSELGALADKADAIAGRLERLIRAEPRAAAEVIDTLQPVQDVESPARDVGSRASFRPYDQRSKERSAAEQDLIRALRMG